jgi:hypothetical protein
MWLRPENHAHAHQSQTGSSRAVPRGQLVGADTCGTRSGPTPSIAARRAVSTHARATGAPAGSSSRAPLAESHVCTRTRARARARTYAPPHTHMSKWVTNPVATAATTGAPVLIHRIVVLLRVLDARRNVRHGENPAPHPRVPPRVNRGTLRRRHAVCVHTAPLPAPVTRAPPEQPTSLRQQAPRPTRTSGAAHTQRERVRDAWGATLLLEHESRESQDPNTVKRTPVERHGGDRECVSKSWRFCVFYLE